MIKGMEHFSFTVSNLDSALHFFCSLLGLKATPALQVQDEGVRKIVGMPGAVLRISLVQVPGGAKIELIEYVKPKGEPVDSNSCNPGAAHIAFLVNDIAKTYQHLSENGVQFVNPPTRLPGNDGTGTWSVCYCKGPDGITVELVEKQT
jgi:lactoylglutathione lyase